MIVDGDVSVVARWGGELKRYGFNVDMLSRRGKERGFQVCYGKNLTGINEEIDTSEMYHAIVPTYLTSDNTTAVMQEIKSPLYDFVVEPRTVPIHYGDIRVGEEEGDYPNAAAAEAEVKKRVAQLWVQGADRPRASATINFVDLVRTKPAEKKAIWTDLAEQYETWDDLEADGVKWGEAGEFAASEEVFLGDSVRAIWEGQVEIEQRVISYEWNSARDEYITITLGQPKRGIESFTNRISTIVSDAVQSQTNGLISVLIESTLNLNEVYINAMGYYKTVAQDKSTGAEKLYLHDRPLLKDSVFIATVPEPGTYMWTQTGWRGGEPVWSQGLTQEGNMLVRFIQAEAIEAKNLSVYAANVRGTLTANQVNFDGARGTNVDLEGIIKASYGKIGAWHIGERGLMGGTSLVMVGESDSDTFIRTGGDTPETSPFYLRKDGYLRADIGVRSKGDFLFGRQGEVSNANDVVYTGAYSISTTSGLSQNFPVNSVYGLLLVFKEGPYSAQILIRFGGQAYVRGGSTSAGFSAWTAL